MAHISFITLLLLSQCAYGTESTDFKKSISEFELENFSQSQLILTQLTKLHPAKALYWFNLANCEFMLQKYPAAILHYEKVINLKSPLASAAKLYKARSLIKLGKKSDAQKLLEAIQQENIGPGIRNSVGAELAKLLSKSERDTDEMALTLYRKGEYKEALNAIQSSEDPENPDVRLLKSLILIKMDRNKDAQNILTTLKHGDYTGTSNELLAQIDYLAKDYWLVFDLAGGTTTNPYFVADSLNPISRAMVKASLSTGYNFLRLTSFSASFSYLGVYENFNQAPDLKIVTHDFQMPLIWNFHPLHITISPFYDQNVWADFLAFTAAGVRTRARWSFENYDIGAEATFTSQTAAASIYSYFTGNTQFYRSYVDYFYAPINIVAFFDFGQDLIGNIPLTGGSIPLDDTWWGPGLRISWQFAEKWALITQLSSYRRNFLTYAQPGNKIREDQESDFTLRFNHRFSASLSGYMSFFNTVNQSSLGPTAIQDKNYVQQIYFAGLLWDIL